MKKYLISFFALSLVFSAIAYPALAKSDKAMGPANKATGGIEILRNDDKRAYAEFNAQEMVGDKAAKGMYQWRAINPDGSLYRKIKVDISDVMFDGDNAWFMGQATEDSMNSNVGRWLVVKAYDGGEPGTNGDMIWWNWFDAKPELNPSLSLKAKTIVGGNLQVHKHLLAE